MTRLWVGEMPVRHIESGRIQPSEYTNWASAIARFDRREKDRRTVSDYMRRMPAGDYEPIQIGRSERYPSDLYVGDGHHRAVAAMQVGLPTVRITWYWLRSWSVDWQRNPLPFAELGLAS